jgi:hypothetical protein
MEINLFESEAEMQRYNAQCPKGGAKVVPFKKPD